MPWSDDTRCLFCDGKLPLYQKLKQGQFCSKQHQKLYWEEQERLAVERLHQTHNELYAYRPPEPIESILGPDIGGADIVGSGIGAPDLYAESSSGSIHDDSPSIAALIPDTVAARIATLPDFVAVDPFEYEMVVRPFAPQPGARVIDMQPARVLPGAGPARLTFALMQRDVPHASAFVGVPAEPSRPQLAPAASFTLSVSDRRDLALAGRLRLPYIAQSPIAPRVTIDAAPIETSIELTRDIAWNLASNLEPRHAVLEDVLLDQLPLADKLRSLLYNLEIAGAAYLPMRRVPAKRFVMKRAVDVPASSGLKGILVEYAPASAGLHDLAVDLGDRAPGAVRGESHPVEILRTPDVPASSGLAGIFGEYAPASAGLHALAASLSQLVPGAIQGETHPVETRALAPLSVSLNAPPATASYEPGTPGLVQLHAATFAPAPPVQPESAGPIDAPMPPYALPVYLQRPAAARSIRHRATHVVRLNYKVTMEPLAGALRPRTLGPNLTLPLSSDPLLPEHRAEPQRDQPYNDAVAAAARASLPWVKLQSMAAHGVDFWRNAPRDLKLLSFAIPALLALVFAPSLPKISFATPQLTASFPVQIREVFSSQVDGIRQSMANRAGVALNEDFRQGLDEWISKGGATTQWSFDETGFVRPGPLALYAPSMNLTDYQMQFMGILDNKAMSWVVRAKDFQNYYVVKLTVAKPGPIPTLRLTRYAVIDGKAQDRHDTRVPIDARNDTNYRVRMDVNGDDFSVMVQEQMIDSWTEPRLQRGGVGFYTADGERSRIRWVQVTHQNDLLGRLCAYLAPIDFPTTTGSW